MKVSYSLIGAIIIIIPSRVYCDLLTKTDIILIQKLEKGETTNIFLHMVQGTEIVLNNIKKRSFTSRVERLNTVAKLLKTHSQNSQKPVLKFLADNSVPYKSFWINNKIFIPGAKLSLVEKLSYLPEISKITEEIIVQLKSQSNFNEKENYSVVSGQRQWGVIKIEANRVWSHTNGTLGKGAVVGSIDTGVRITHQALKHNFRGAYGWYDAIGRRPYPYDDEGHGTHVMGTIVGAKGIGIAPESQWMACKAGNTLGQFPQDWLYECGEFILCPTLANGTSPDCSKAPHVVSNSWGGSGGDSFYDDITNAWITAGIIPFFAIGNSGPDCRTTKSPGDRNVIAVGATTLIDSLAHFSSRGDENRNYNFKPDISAPGADIISASHKNDGWYVKMSGTSMACPHAAGVGALLFSLKNEITYQEMKNILFEAAETGKLIRPLNYCGNSSNSLYPNNAFGHGRINAYKSVMNLLSLPSTGFIWHENAFVFWGAMFTVLNNFFFHFR